MEEKIYDKSRKSKCCNADVFIGGDDREGTHYYICDKCNNPCDGITKSPKNIGEEILRILQGR